MSHRRRFPEAYWEGGDAYLEGKTLEDNPYPKPAIRIPTRFDKWIWWRRGWFGWC